MSFFGSIGGGAFTGIFELPVVRIDDGPVAIKKVFDKTIPKNMIVDAKVAPGPKNMIVDTKVAPGPKNMIVDTKVAPGPKNMIVDKKGRGELIKLDPREKDGFNPNGSLAPFRSLEGLKQRVKKIKPAGVKAFLKRHKLKVKGLVEAEQKEFIDFVSKF